MTQVRLLITGDVVGVGFRAWIKIQAKKFGVVGWARNVFNKPEIFGPHGGVEVVLQGGGRTINDVVDTLRAGSPISRVDHIEIKHENPSELLTEFLILKSEAYSRHQ